MLPDHQRREIQYALEYAMFATLDSALPQKLSPEFESGQEFWMVQQKTDDNFPIPVPHDWEPSLKVAQRMVAKEQPIPQLLEQISQLKELVAKTLLVRNSNIACLITADNYLVKARTYLVKACAEELKARADEN